MTSAVLTARNVTFSYEHSAVLHAVDVSLNAGEVVALIGHHGAGKSTLLRCLLGQLRSSGDIEWEAKDLLTWKNRELARRVAYLSQMPTWDIDQRVIDVLRLGRAPYWSAFGIESQTDAQVISRVAEKLALGALMNRPLEELSGGQRQRVFIGRCLVQEPIAMLLDEPNTHLDVRHQVELGRLLRDVARESRVAVLMASHDLNLAALTADRLILLHEGKIQASGSADAVLRPDILEKIYGVQFERIERSGRAPAIIPRFDPPHA